jgi:hypothetical protein
MTFSVEIEILPNLKDPSLTPYLIIPTEPKVAQ